MEFIGALQKSRFLWVKVGFGVQSSEFRAMEGVLGVLGVGLQVVLGFGFLCSRAFKVLVGFNKP